MLGLALIEECLQDNSIEHIYAVVRPHSKKTQLLPNDSRIVCIPCGVDCLNELSDLIQSSCDVFYHFAWTNTENRNADMAGQALNVVYTLRAVDAAYKLGCRTFIGAGSQAEYGSLDVNAISPDTPVNPVQPYGIAKYAAGRFATEACERYGMSCIWVRVFSVYGIHDKPNTMVATTVKKLLVHEETAFTAGEQLWDYLYSSDAGRAFYLIGKKCTGKEVYCLGSGRADSLKSYIRIMRDIINPALDDEDLGLGKIPYGKNAVMNLCADPSSLSEDTGWEPRVSFPEGIRLIVDHMKSELD